MMLELSEPSDRVRDDGVPYRARKVSADQTGDALRLAGLRDQLHPRDAMAFIYPDRGYFAYSAARQRESEGYEVHGPYETEHGLLGIVDSREAQRLACGDRGVTDPSLPDFCWPSCLCHHPA